MSATIVARAPGKIFLTGEYAVLAAAPALVAAIDRYAEVRMAIGAASGPCTIESLADGRRYTIDDPEHEQPLGGDVGAVLAALRVASAWAPSIAGREVTAVVDSTPFLAPDGRKLGLGRSAATVTAAVAALLALAGHRDRAEVFEAAVAAHALFQEGRGSGADVAAAAHGGVIAFRRDGGRIDVAPRALPPGLRVVVGWTGEPVPTDPIVRRFTSHVAAVEPRALIALRAVAERAAEAAGAGDVAAFSSAVAESADALDELGRELGIPIVTPTLAKLIAAAHRVGAIAKPSGAGGGDCGIAFAASAEQADAVRAAWHEVGIVPLDVSLAPRGVEIDERDVAGAEVPVG